MKIAMIGHKDFPCRSGGVEVVVYELATRLAARGEEVTVYNRGKQKHHNKYKTLGVNVIRSFTFKNHSLNAVVYSFTATLHALFRHYDVIHYHAIGPSAALLLAHLCGKKTVSTVHGLNWRVDKWGSFASRYLKFGEKIAAKYADEVITLSDEMHDYFLKTYGRDTTLIKNAITPVPDLPDTLLREKYGLTKDSYILYLGRISPEKGPEDLIEAYKKAHIPQKLVLAGGIAEKEYADKIKSLIGDDPNILCTGFVAGDEMSALYANCALYVLPSHTEGLALSLLEALSCGANCLVSDIIENTSVLKDFGDTFKVRDTDDLAHKLASCAGKPKSPDSVKARKEYILRNYSYDRVIDEHLKIYHQALEKKVGAEVKA